MSGLSRITKASAGWLKPRVAEDGHVAETVAVLRSGMRMPVDLGDYNGRMLYLFGTCDPKIVSICRALLREGDVFLDIGANYGSVGLLCRDAVGGTGEVHLFEPQPDLCARITRCIAGDAGAGAKPVLGVTLHPVGLMDRDDSLTLHRSAVHSGRSSFVAATVGTTTVSVPVKDVKTFIPSIVKDRPFGVKLDVEGAESLLMPHLLKLAGLRFILFESNVADERPKLWEQVTAGGLQLLGVPRTLVTAKVTTLRRPEDMGAYHDLLAVRAARPIEIGRTLGLSALARAMSE